MQEEKSKFVHFDLIIYKPRKETDSKQNRIISEGLKGD